MPKKSCDPICVRVNKTKQGQTLNLLKRKVIHTVQTSQLPYMDIVTCDSDKKMHDLFLFLKIPQNDVKRSVQK